MFAKELKETYELLKPYAEKDPTAFYSAEKFRIGSEALQKFCELRAESIRRQLDGTLAFDSDKQDDPAKVTAGGFHLQDMGVVQEK